jgi:hypothetical protein
MSWYPLDDADADFLTSAPEVHRYVLKLPVAPDVVWESLQSDASLSAWGPGVDRVTWTSPRPFGIGTTRDIVLPLRSITVRERFFRWDEGRGYSFAAYAANRPLLRRLAEDYVLEPDGDGTLFTWTVAIELTRRLAPVERFAAPLNKRAFGLVASSAKRHFAQQG